MKWIKNKKMQVLAGTVAAALAASYGIQLNGGPPDEMEGMRCKCIWYADSIVGEEGVNKN